MENDTESSDSLSQSLGRMSIDTSKNPSYVPASGSGTAATNSSQQTSQQTLRKASSTQSLRSRSPGPSSRSPSAFASQQNQSPLSKRKSYGALDKREQQTTPSKPSFRRTSSTTQSPKASNFPSTSLPIPENEPAPLTAASVAAQYLSQEIHNLTDLSSINSQTLVIIHDACYGHRFSRPKSSKTTLSLIVERPERVQACVSGIATAYVRLGQRHNGGLYPPHPSRPPPSEAPFAIRRSTRLMTLNSSPVTAVHGTKWMQELSVMCEAAGQRLASGGKELTRPETPGGGVTKPKLHEGDLYLCKESMEAFQGALGGVMDGIDAVFRGPSASLDSMQNVECPKRVFVCVRPPGHHCSADLPSGFCWLNNVHVGVEYAAQTYGLTHAAIIDFDLHHGDGSQTITWDRNNKSARAPKNTPLPKRTSIGYFSLHDINSYPSEYGDQDKVQNASICLENAHNQTIWNVHLQPWKTEPEFWQLYETTYSVLFEKAKRYLQMHTQRLQASGSNAKSAIFISAGFDASEWEGEGMQRHKVNVPTEFYARFTKDVIKVAEDPTTGANGRVVSVLEGGYSDRALMSGVMSHVCGLVSVGGTSLNSIAQDEKFVANTAASHSTTTYDRHWWSASNLAEYEAAMNPTATHIARKVRSQELSTFATPTQSFTAKVVDPAKVYRSLSGAVPPPESVRPLTPPPPDVDWAIAAHELQKLLLPKHRSVSSYRHDELSEPRIKRERHSAIGLPASVTNDKMKLRGRKATIPEDACMADDNEELSARSLSDSRRRTIDSLPIMIEQTNITGLERPLTSDSKAQSDTSVAAADTSESSRRTSRATSPTKRVETQAKVHRTRRVSGVKPDLVSKETNIKQPPIPKIPIKFNPNQSSSTSGDVEKSKGNDDLAAITSGIKRIIIRPAKTTEQAEPSKPVRKTPVPRAPKSTTSKSTAGRAQKPTKDAMSTGTNGTLQKAETGATNPAFPNTTQQSSMGGEGGIRVKQEDAVLQSEPDQLKSSDVNDHGQSAQLASHPLATPMDNMTSAVGNGSLKYPAVHPSDSRTSLEAAQLDGAFPMNGNGIASEHSAGPRRTTGTPQNADSPQEFIAYNPSLDYPISDSKHSPSLVSNQEPLTWLPPNTGTPAKAPLKPNKLGRENLPVFSNTGAIPFGQASSAEHSTAKPAVQGQQTYQQ